MRRKKWKQKSPSNKTILKMFWKWTHDFARLVNPDHRFVTIEEHKLQTVTMLAVALTSVALFFQLKRFMFPEEAGIKSIFFALGATLIIEMMLIYYEIKKLNGGWKR